MIKKIRYVIVTLFMCFCMISCSFAVTYDQNNLNSGPNKMDIGQFKEDKASFIYQTWKYNDSFVKVDLVGKCFIFSDYVSTVTIESGNDIVTVKNNPSSVPFWVSNKYNHSTTVFHSNLTAESFYWIYKNSNLK